MSQDTVAAPAPRRTAFSAPVGAIPLGALVGGSAAAFGGLLLALRAHQLPYFVCYFRLMTGLPCLTCGGTRAMLRLVAFDPAGALAMNPLVTIVAWVMGAWAAADLVLLPRRRALRLSFSPGAARAFRWTLAAAVLANWLYLVAVGR